MNHWFIVGLTDIQIVYAEDPEQLQKRHMGFTDLAEAIIYMHGFYADHIAEPATRKAIEKYL